MSILCIGEMLIDFTPVAGMKNTYTANPGGAPANVAVSVARNEIRSGFLGKLGNDDFGKLLKKTLEENNVEILCPELTNEATTTLAFVTLDESGDRSFTFARKPGADLLLSKDDVKAVDFSQWDIVHAGSVSQSGLPERNAVSLAIRRAKEAGKLVSFDINYRDKIWSFDDCKYEVDKLLPYIDLLKISDEELDFVGGEKNIPEFMVRNDISVLVLTKGKDGSSIFYIDFDDIPNTLNETNVMDNGFDIKCSEIKVPSVKVPVKDTTGAGDAFWGGFLSSLIRQGVKKTSDINLDILRMAGGCGTISGGICITKPGGIPAIPTWKEIEQVLKQE